MQHSIGNRESNTSGLQLSVFFAFIFVVIGILLGALLELGERLRHGVKKRQTIPRMTVWLKERAALGSWRSEP